MPVKNETSTRFMDEVRIISGGVVCIAILAFLVVVLVVFASLMGKADLPVAVAVPLGIVAGTALAGYILLIGYVNQDAGRRGMSRLLWTLIAIFVPNALGIVLYFILRKPRVLKCPQCGEDVEPRFSYCPRCRNRLSAVCPHCQQAVDAGGKFCPYCGGDLAANANAVPAAVPSQT